MSKLRTGWIQLLGLFACFTINRFGVVVGHHLVILPTNYALGVPYRTVRQRLLPGRSGGILDKLNQYSLYALTQRKRM